MKQLKAHEYKETAIKLHGLTGLDEKLSFYYDETNNIRKFYLKEEGFNFYTSENFILGGVLHDTKKKQDLSELFTNLHLQKSATELKLKHLARGDFLNCLKSQSLNYFLRWIYESDLYVHYVNINLFYYSLVDIVDSAIFADKELLKLDPYLLGMIKNDLYKIAMDDKELVVQILYKYDYPNIKSDQIRFFIDELFLFFSEYENDPEFHLGITSLKQILKQSSKINSLPFLEDEDDFILIENFLHFYLEPLYLFTNSTHVFDNEHGIEELLSQYQIVDGERIIDNYTFVESRTNQLIQVSDVFSGIYGKYTGFINHIEKDSIEGLFKNLSHLQIDTFVWMHNNISKAHAKNPAFLNSCCSLDELEKNNIVEEMLWKYSL